MSAGLANFSRVLYVSGLLTSLTFLGLGSSISKCGASHVSTPASRALLEIAAVVEAEIRPDPTTRITLVEDPA